MLTKAKINAVLSFACMLLALLTLICIGNTEVNAETVSGNCGDNGDNVKWSFDTETGVLEITGNGAMIEPKSTSMPWNEYTAKIEAAVIGEGVTHISSHAFRCCLFMTSVTIPKTVKSIGVNAFYLCNQLTDVHLTDIDAWCGITLFNLVSNPLSIAENLYLNGERVTDLVIENVIKLGSGCFYRFQGIQSLTVGGMVTSIPSDAFSECPNLKTVSIGDNVKNISSDAFEGCTELTSVSIGDGVRVISACAFENCTKLTNITIGDGVTQIGYDAFNNTGYYNGKNWYSSVLYIGKYLIKAGENKSGSYTVRDGTTVIADDAFRGCLELTDVTLPDSVTHIGNSAFYSCRALTSITFGDGIEHISSGAFGWCESLSSVSFKKTDKWHLDDSFSPEKGTVIDEDMLSDTAEAAKLLKNNFYAWIRVTHIHEYVASVTAPTCTAKGYTSHTCECGENYLSDETAKKEHTLGDWIVDTKAEIGKEGSKHRQCTVCSAVLETEIIPAITESGCFGDSGMYLSYLMTVLIPAAFVFLGKSLFM